MSFTAGPAFQPLANGGAQIVAPDGTVLATFSYDTTGFGAVRVPNMTTTQRDALTNVAAGLIIYNTSTNKLNVRVAAGWEAITSA